MKVFDTSILSDDDQHFCVTFLMGFPSFTHFLSCPSFGQNSESLTKSIFFSVQRYSGCSRGIPDDLMGFQGASGSLMGVSELFQGVSEGF